MQNDYKRQPKSLHIWYSKNTNNLFIPERVLKYSCMVSRRSFILLLDIMPEDIEYAPDCENVEDSKLKLPEQHIATVEAKSGEEDEDVVYHEYS